MSGKDAVARALVAAHVEIDPSISAVYRLVTDQEAEPHEPVKLLEVNPETTPSGIVPIAFHPHPPDVLYPSVVVEVTEEEYARIRDGSLALPAGWRIDEQLFPTAA